MDQSYVTPLTDCAEAEIGRWLWCMEDVRRRLLERLDGISQRTLDTRIGDNPSIGSLLYHIAIVEIGWLYGEVLCTDFPTELGPLFPWEPVTDNGMLTHVEGENLEGHLHRLRTIREIFLSHFRSMTLADWRTPRVLDEYSVTPEWVVYHLIEHEANHRGQIFQLLRQLR